ncbi:MAG: type II toxin-antitoxin system HigB family toxin [Rhodanobacteraceae bacterium]
MRLIALKALREFWAEHRDAEQPLRAWANEVRQARWTTPADIKMQFATSSILKSRRVVFNIKGNEYRIVVAVAYRFQAVYVKFVGTHTEYDRIDADEVDTSP